jgi:hypothetical protein
MTTGRKRPVHIDLAQDVIRAEIDAELVPPAKYRPMGAVRGDPELIKQAAQLFVNSPTPGIMSGGGDSGGPSIVGIRAAMVTTYPDFTHPDPTERERELTKLEDDIVGASRLGADLVRVTAGQAHPGVGSEKSC